MTEEGDFTFHGISGKVNIFAMPHCETDRFWRKQLGITAEKYMRPDISHFDECRNAFMKPKPPVSITILDNLHKRSDYDDA